MFSEAVCEHHVLGVTMTTQCYEGPVLAWDDDFILEIPESHCSRQVNTFHITLYRSGVQQHLSKWLSVNLDDSSERKCDCTSLQLPSRLFPLEFHMVVLSASSV